MILGLMRSLQLDQDPLRGLPSSSQSSNSLDNRVTQSRNSITQLTFCQCPVKQEEGCLQRVLFNFNWSMFGLQLISAHQQINRHVLVNHSKLDISIVLIMNLFLYFPFLSYLVELFLFSFPFCKKKINFQFFKIKTSALDLKKNHKMDILYWSNTNDFEFRAGFGIQQVYLKTGRKIEFPSQYLNQPSNG